MLPLALLALLLFCAPARAAGAATFNEQYSEAWTLFRNALYQSAPEQDDPAAAASLRAFSLAWRGLMSQWGARPPRQYAEDPRFAEELSAIAEVAAEARRQIRQSRPDQAHVTLQQIRSLLADMRRRNGLAAYDDCLDAFDEKLAETADDDFDQPELGAEHTTQLCEQLAVLAYLAERLELQAPDALLQDAEFFDMAEQIAQQVRVLNVAAQAGRRDPLVAALADLRRSFDKFYLLYG